MNNNICIYCGSAIGRKAAYTELAREVGKVLARRGIGVVYGGGRVGLMGVVADAVLDGGGQVIGVIPEPLATKEIAHDGLTELHIVADMHERKAMMARRSIAFLTLPGGIGTFEEFFETLTWAALGLHEKPLGILNVAGYFDPLLAMLDHGITEKFVRPHHLKRLIISTEPEAIVHELMASAPSTISGQSIDFAKD
jgi:uncharacterized protein (TIGR00730 family)